MAIPTLDSSAAAVEGTGTSLAVPFPGTVNAGDLLLLTYGVSSATGASIPSGWTRERTASQGACTTELYSKSASGSETGTLSFTVGENGEPKLARMYRSPDANSIEAVGSSSASSKTIDHPAIVSTGTDRLAMTVTSINDDETASSFTGESNGDLTLLVDDTTALDNDHALSLQTADLALAVTLSGGTWAYSGATEQWATIAWAIFNQSFTQTDKTINVTFTTSMANTPIPITVKAISIAFGTVMALTRKLSYFRTFNVAFGTAISVVKKTSPVAKTIGFATTMVTTTSRFVTKAISVAFVTAMSTTSVATFFRTLNVAFSNTMSLAKTIKKTIAVAFATTFSLTRKVSVTKTVAFVTSMALTTSLNAFSTATVSFSTAFALATQFVAGIGGVFGAVLIVLRRRRRRK